MTLDQAQLAKKRLIAAKLLVRPGARVLDIGCGWGGMALYLARVCDADVTGITLSQEQHRVATERAAAAGLSDRVRFRLQDYREVDEHFDNIVSVGMFEHVGLRAVPDLLPHRPAAPRPRRRDAAALDGAAERAPYNQPFMEKYIFPGGYIPALSEVVPAVENSGLLIRDIEILSLHYAETTREWRRRFLANREEVLELYDERFIRMWEFYLAGSESAFRYDAHARLPPAARPRPGPRAADPRLHPRGDGPARRGRARLPRLRRAARRPPTPAPHRLLRASAPDGAVVEEDPEPAGEDDPAGDRVQQHRLREARAAGRPRAKITPPATVSATVTQFQNMRCASPKTSAFTATAARSLGKSAAVAAEEQRPEHQLLRQRREQRIEHHDHQPHPRRPPRQREEPAPAPAARRGARRHRRRQRHDRHLAPVDPRPAPAAARRKPGVSRQQQHRRQRHPSNTGHSHSGGIAAPSPAAARRRAPRTPPRAAGLARAPPRLSPAPGISASPLLP